MSRSSYNISQVRRLEIRSSQLVKHRPHQRDQPQTAKLQIGFDGFSLLICAVLQIQETLDFHCIPGGLNFRGMLLDKWIFRSGCARPIRTKSASACSRLISIMQVLCCCWSYSLLHSKSALLTFSSCLQQHWGNVRTALSLLRARVFNQRRQGRHPEERGT